MGTRVRSFAPQTNGGNRNGLHQRCVAGWAAPHELQKRAPATQGFPQVVQKKPPPAAGCGGAATCRCGSEESAQISAAIQPMNVHPVRRFSTNMAVDLDLLRARYAGRKYRNSDTSRKIGWK